MRLLPALQGVFLMISLVPAARLSAQTLLHYYSFDSGTITTSGSLITGATGAGAALAAFGAGPTVDPNGRFGSAADFTTGSLDTALFANAASLGNNFSISFWLKTPDVTALAQSYVLQTGDASGSRQNAVLFGYVSGEVELYGAGAWALTHDPRPVSGLVLPPALNNTWLNIVYAYDGATLRGYLNGTEEFSRAATFDLYGSGGLSVGSARNGAALVPGSLDDVAIWRGALTAGQVLDLQSSPVLPAAIPEPATYAMIAGVGALGLAAGRRRRQGAST